MEAKNLAAIAAALALGAAGSVLLQRKDVPVQPVFERAALDACLRPPLRARECARLLGRDAGR